MNPKEIMAARLRVPFVPFRLKLKDGTHFDVLKSQDVLPTRNTTLVGIYQDFKNVFPDVMKPLDNDNIASLELLVPETKYE